MDLNRSLGLQTTVPLVPDRKLIQYIDLKLAAIDGSIAMACPPLWTLLHFMRDDQFEGKGLEHPEIRSLFARENMLASDWYAARLAAKQAADRQLWQRHVATLEKFLTKSSYANEVHRLGIEARLRRARIELERVKSPIYLKALRGTLGLQPLRPAPQQRT